MDEQMLSVLAVERVRDQTFTGPANSPWGRFVSTLSTVLPSKTTWGWPSAAFTLTSSTYIHSRMDKNVPPLQNGQKRTAHQRAVDHLLDRPSATSGGNLLSTTG